jgi:hypothetical protein
VLTARSAVLLNEAEEISRSAEASSDKERIAMQVGDSQYFVGWGTLALINAGLAQGKQRSGLNWFCFPSSSVRSRL